MLARSAALISLAFCALLVNAQTPFVLYGGESPSTVSSFMPGGAVSGAGPITKVVADDIAFPAGYQGQSISEIGMTLTSMNDGIAVVRPRLRFWDADGPSTSPTGVDSPGYCYGGPMGLTLSSVPLLKGVVVSHSASLSPGTLTVPSGTWWCGITFDNNANANGFATPAELNNVGVALTSPSVGSSTDTLYVTATPGSFFGVSNPAGAFQSVGGSPQANLALWFAVEGQDFSGTVSLGDVGTMAATRAIQYEARSGSVLITSGTLTVGTTSPSSSFSLTLPRVLPAGATNPVSLTFDGSSFLKKTVQLTVPSGTPVEIPLGSIVLQNGDVDRSGEVDAIDIDAVIAAFGDTGVADTDVDVSGEVDAIDIDIVIANFGAVDN